MSNALQVLKNDFQHKIELHERCVLDGQVKSWEDYREQLGIITGLGYCYRAVTDLEAKLTEEFEDE